MFNSYRPLCFLVIVFYYIAAYILHIATVFVTFNSFISINILFVLKET